jgi:hypothetical protein
MLLVQIGPRLKVLQGAAGVVLLGQAAAEAGHHAEQQAA